MVDFKVMFNLNLARRYPYLKWRKAPIKIYVFSTIFKSTAIVAILKMADFKII